MNEELLKQLSVIEEAFFNEEATEENVEAFFDLWPEIQDAIRGLGSTDADGTYHKPEITDVEALNEDDTLDSVYNLLGDVETTLCQKEYAEQHLQYCRELLDLIDQTADSGFFEQYETGIGKALVDLGRNDEAKAYFESLLKKGPKANYISNAMWAARDMNDTEWLKEIVNEHLTGKNLPEYNDEIQEMARDMLSRLG